jgi:hypothetical protein
MEVDQHDQKIMPVNTAPAMQRDFAALHQGFVEHSLPLEA